MLLRTLPRVKKRPMKEENAITKSRTLLFLQSTPMPSKRFSLSMGARATSEGGYSGLSLKTSWKKMKTQKTMYVYVTKTCWMEALISSSVVAFSNMKPEMA